ncbi:MAG TPA: GlsB/YeaQ/YmgE family stress response membrane protein [Burkholderiaceae bacterium]|jgi:uncharacterized membrane protein YeaQ/YmgE (transglycosylase-associated protein family)
MVNLIVSLLVGVFAGWIVGMLVRAETTHGMLFNLLVGIVGALVGGYVLSPAIGMPAAGGYPLHIGSIAVSLIGSVVFLALFNLLWPGRRSH